MKSVGRFLLDGVGFLALLGTAAFVLSQFGVFKSKDRKFAESICGTNVFDESCIKGSFPAGSSEDRLLKYLRGAGFRFWSKRPGHIGELKKFFVIRDIETMPYPERIVVIFEAQHGKIDQVRMFRHDEIERWE